ncbi:MAG: nuclear transport factor 2 family protein [Saprospiraceae bacterium]|nr:nuclear transport factor 2 family protein [Saprospiraceae bacterium]
MSPTNTVDAFFKAIIERDAEAIIRFYVADELTYVILEGPRLSTKGFTKIADGWRAFCVSPFRLHSIEWLEGAFAEAEGSLAWVSGVVALTVSLHEKTFVQTFRVSFVLKKSVDTEGWLIRHEHVSGALLDPYGTGDWVKSV